MALPDLTIDEMVTVAGAWVSRRRHDEFIVKYPQFRPFLRPLKLQERLGGRACAASVANAALRRGNTNVAGALDDALESATGPLATELDASGLRLSTPQIDVAEAILSVWHRSNEACRRAGASFASGRAPATARAWPRESVYGGTHHV